MRCRTWTCSLFSNFCSSACDRVSPLGALVFVDSFVAGLLRRSPPGEGAELVLVVLLYLVLLLVLAVEERFLLACWGLLSLLGACLSFSLVIVDFLILSVFGTFLRHFPSCGVPARWRDLRHVVLTLAASSFPSWRVLHSSRSRRLLR